MPEGNGLRPGASRLAAALLCAALAACGGPPADTDPAAEIPVSGSAGSPEAGVADAALADAARADAARAGIRDFSQTLQRTLAAALAEGGPTAAIDVCRVAAPAIADSAAASHGLILARTALRVRNPDNAPDAFEREVLERFAAAASAGEALETLEHATVIEDAAGVREFRFMKAIPMQEQPCTVCHGTRIPEEVVAHLASAYPDDAATGFSAGDLRGAFSVRIRLP